MSEERIEPEVLAAFVAGTLSDIERQKVLDVLARSDDALDDLADVALLDRDVPDEAPMVDTVPLAIPVDKPRVRGRSRVLRWWLPLAAAAGLGIVVFATSIRRGSPSAGDEIALVATAIRESGSGSISRALGARWDMPGWSEIRGETSDVVSERGRAFRIGARLTDLRLAAATKDTAAAASVSRLLSGLVSTLPLGAPLAARVTDFTTPSELARLDGRQLEVQIGDLVAERMWFLFGAVVESARLAAAAGNASYFTSTSRARSRLDALARLNDAAPAADRTALEPFIVRFRALFLATDSDVDLVGVRAALTAIIAEAAR